MSKISAARPEQAPSGANFANDAGARAELGYVRHTNYSPITLISTRLSRFPSNS